MISPQFHRFDEVESTNDVALDMGRRGEPEGTVVTALTQTKGRGRLGRAWWDRPGESAIVSILLRPRKTAAELGQLAFVAGLAVARLLEEHSLDGVALKWPNDVMLGDGKVAGILVETEVSTSGTLAVIGIGINVGQSEFPPEISDTATSILLSAGVAPDVETLARSAAEKMLECYEAYLSRGFEEILRGWRKYMWGLGSSAVVRTSGQRIEGRLKGVSPEGALIVVDRDGREHTVHTADGIRLSES